MRNETNTTEASNQIQLGNLNDRLEKYIKGFNTDYESIYKAGVEMGRQLEQSNAPDFRLPFFIKIEEERNINDITRKLHREIADLLLHQIHAAIKEIINTEYDWTVGVGMYYQNDGKFSDLIIQKFGIAFDSIDQLHTNGHFEASFYVEGKLKKCFDSYGYIPRIEVTLDNESGDDHVSMSCDEDVESLYSPALIMPLPKSVDELDKLRKLKVSLEKVLMFNLISTT